MTARAAAAILLGAALAAGCFRTTYRNFGVPPASAEGAPREPASRWQHFFVWGLAPDERTIHAQRICGEGRVREIRTRQTFVQGLIEAFAGYVVNVYSPYTGEVVCGDERASR